MITFEKTGINSVGIDKQLKQHQCMQKEILKNCLIEGIGRIKENLNRWYLISCQKESKLSYTHTEVKSLCKNWMIRCLKTIYTRDEVIDIFRFCEIDSVVDMNLSLLSIRLRSHRYNRNDSRMTYINEILEEINIADIPAYQENTYKIEKIPVERDATFALASIRACMSNIQNIKF